MNQGKGRKKYVCGIAGILIVSLIAFYVVLNGTENNQTSQVKNEIYTLEREGFEMTEEEAERFGETEDCPFWENRYKEENA